MANEIYRGYSFRVVGSETDLFAWYVYEGKAEPGYTNGYVKNGLSRSRSNAETEARKAIDYLKRIAK